LIESFDNEFLRGISNIEEGNPVAQKEQKEYNHNNLDFEAESLSR